ncbi:MAG: acetyltransferase protein [Firmicutes bacterium]|nr:acetyltransferase protein [Bacillota bacterium]
MMSIPIQKKITQDEVQKIFLSVDWLSGQYPSRLYKVLKNSSTVLFYKKIGFKIMEDGVAMQLCNYRFVLYSENPTLKFKIYSRANTFFIKSINV